MCCIFRKKKKIVCNNNNSETKTQCQTPTTSVSQMPNERPIPTQNGGMEKGKSTTADQQQPAVLGISNPLQHQQSSTPQTKTPKKGAVVSKEKTERSFLRTMPGTCEENTKSKLQSTQDHPIPETNPQPRAPLKVEKKNNNNSVKPQKVESLVASKSQKRKKDGQNSKRPSNNNNNNNNGDGGKADESEHFEEGEDKSREDVSGDDTLKGVGTQMPNYES